MRCKELEGEGVREGIRRARASYTDNPKAASNNPNNRIETLAIMETQVLFMGEIRKPTDKVTGSNKELVRVVIRHSVDLESA